MPQLHYSIQIDQAPLTVHNVLVDKEAYATWTYSFSSASRFDGDWSEGSQMLFTFVGANQTQWGMVARVDKNQPGELIQLRYVDQWKNNPQTPHNWNSALETYRFIPISQGTKLSCTLEVDNNEACIAFFDQAWPAALQRLKDLCEQQ